MVLEWETCFAVLEYTFFWIFNDISDGWEAIWTIFYVVRYIERSSWVYLRRNLVREEQTDGYVHVRIRKVVFFVGFILIVQAKLLHDLK